MKIEHIAFSVGSKEKVESLTAQIKADGFTVLSGLRTTGDGCFERTFSNQTIYLEVIT